MWNVGWEGGNGSQLWESGVRVGLSACLGLGWGPLGIKGMGLWEWGQMKRHCQSLSPAGESVGGTGLGTGSGQLGWECLGVGW